MGLDQYFFTKKDYDSEEILHFSKYYTLDTFIRELTGLKENGGLVRLHKFDIERIIGFIIKDADKNYIFENYISESSRYNDKFFKIIGVLCYYKNSKETLYYGSDF